MSNFTIPDYKVINENFDPTPMIGEVFKPVSGYEGMYEVSSFGRVRSFKGNTTRILKGCPNSNGYPLVSLFRDGKTKSFNVHRLVAAAHLGPAPADRPHVLHADDVKANNRISNLRYGDDSANKRDRVLNGNDPDARKTHCPQGHAYVHANTYVRNGRRYCISCQRARAAAAIAKKYGRAYDVNEDADRRYIELTTEPGADMSPALSQTLAKAA